ncbi:ABC transporter substrate-binding protein [Pleionea sp. CnH1-48]|uniref:ABC transporter substrate-binding protein n=1 Tax=Pleionea sp. CnH1-48 TaxID=2954494 RepID=UPI0020983244|nr:ABC transporter substrate-binding protein [Pleionea sp. CnH1-48]MCO7226062.1 ABC transporter substrate-binding protein [Pleionea sp. CnH1-48]
MMRQGLLFLALASFWLQAVAGPNSTQQRPIRIITNNWTSQIVLAHITGELFKQQGYPVKYVSSSTAQQWGALAHGAAHVQVEVWEGTMSEKFNDMAQRGLIVDAGTHDATTREDWWYPKYVEPLCPGLPDWQALKKCAAIFSTQGNQTGTYYAGPWEKPDEARVRALALNFDIVLLKESDDLWRVLSKAYDEKRPIVLFNWTPNWVESRYEGQFVEFPAYAPECETQPEWGVNKNLVYDCGNPANGWLKKAAWPGMKNQWPCAYQLLEKINFSNQQLANASALVVLKKMSHLQAAQHWLKENKNIWSPWLPQGCQP